MADRQHVSNRAMITFNEDNIQRQYFTFPYPEMCYIRQNADAETQLKLRQTCKFFHKWNPLVIVKNLFFGREPSPYAGEYDLYVLNFDEMPKIDIVTNGIHCEAYDKRIISKIRRCEAKFIWLRECELSKEEFLFFTQSGIVQQWGSSNTSVRDKHGKIISLEALLVHLPNAEYVKAKVQDVIHEDPYKIVSMNNKIKILELEFHGPINVNHFCKLLQKVLSPKAYLDIYFHCLTNETYLQTFEAEMEAKMKTWMPQIEKPILYIYGL